jgi:hypothetical protein
MGVRALLGELNFPHIPNKSRDRQPCPRDAGELALDGGYRREGFRAYSLSRRAVTRRTLPSATRASFGT